MRKISKMIFMLLLILVLTFGYTSIANAAAQADYIGNDEYQELADEDDAEDKKVPANDNKEPAQTDPANKSNESHSQAGSFETSIIMAASGILLIIAGCGYVKYRKYNFKH